MIDTTDAAKDPNILEAVKVSGVLTGVLIIVVTYVIVRVVNASLQGLGERFGDKRLVISQINTLLRFLLILGGIALAIGASIQLSKEVVLALTGTAAVTIGLALKDLTSSVLAGITILIDRPFQVGDRVSFGGFYGEISTIGLRSVRLVTLDDNVVTIPNNKFLTDIASSGNYGALDMQIQMDFYIGVDQDVALAKKLVGECMVSNRYVYLGKPWVVLVNQVVHESYFAVRLRAKAYVLDVKYEKAYETDVTERIMESFARNGIMAPAILHRSAGTPLDGVSGSSRARGPRAA
jgi:small-conductance mechanosensitive channel